VVLVVRLPRRPPPLPQQLRLSAHLLVLAAQ
jgi:hypothetical protein